MKAWKKGALAGIVVGAIWGLLWMLILVNILDGNDYTVPRTAAYLMLFPIHLTARLNNLFGFHPDSGQIMCLFPATIGAATLAAAGAVIGELASRMKKKKR